VFYRFTWILASLNRTRILFFVGNCNICWRLVTRANCQVRSAKLSTSSPFSGNSPCSGPGSDRKAPFHWHQAAASVALFIKEPDDAWIALAIPVRAKGSNQSIISVSRHSFPCFSFDHFSVQPDSLVARVTSYLLILKSQNLWDLPC
jgi:hypothetical protein